MWRNTYKDYKADETWVQEQVEPGKGIIGCEMHELNGWGETQHQRYPKRPVKRPVKKPVKRKGAIRTFLNALFRRS